MTSSICAKCGATEGLVTHHVSYCPEITQTLCRRCDASERRHPKSERVKVLKVYPQQGIVRFPRYILEQFGELVEFYSAPVSPAGILVPYNTSLKSVERSLKIVLDDVRFRRKLEAELKRKEANEGKKSK